MTMKILFDKVIENKELEIGDFDKIINSDNSTIWEVFFYTEKIKEAYNKKKVKLCSIINAKSGKCPENCAFCAQSKHHKTDIKIFSLLSPKEILKNAVKMEDAGSHRFSIVTSGTSISTKKDKLNILKAVELIKEHTSLNCCCSLGIIDKNFMQDLKKAGISAYHHNLETARSFFPNICTTHDYDDDVNTVKTAKEIGFYVCSGGIFGLGESWEQRIELAYTLKKLDVDSLALNFLNPVRGTKLENNNFLTPMDCLKIVSVYRFVHFNKDIRICGGREVNLKELQPLVLPAGANGLMIGNYLTTKGRLISNDFEMIKELGVEIDEYR